MHRSIHAVGLADVLFIRYWCYITNAFEIVSLDGSYLLINTVALTGTGTVGIAADTVALVCYALCFLPVTGGYFYVAVDGIALKPDEQIASLDIVPTREDIFSANTLLCHEMPGKAGTNSGEDGFCSLQAVRYECRTPRIALFQANGCKELLYKCSVVAPCAFFGADIPRCRINMGCKA